MIEISSLLIAAFVVGLMLTLLLLSLQFIHADDRRALSIWVAAELASTLSLGVLLLQPGWSFGPYFPAFFAHLGMRFCMPLLFTLGQLLLVAALLKVRQLILPSPLLPVLVLLPPATGFAALLSNSPLVTPLILLFTASSILLTLSCALIWPLARNHAKNYASIGPENTPPNNRGAKALLALISSQLVYGVAFVAWWIASQSGFAHAQAGSALPVGLVMMHIVVEISKTLAFILLLNERQFAIVKKQHADMDKRVMETTIAMNELRKTEQEFRSLAENISSTIVRYNLSGQIAYMNPQWLGHLNLNATDVTGKHYQHVFNPQYLPDVEQMHRTYRQVVETRKSSLLETRIKASPEKHQIHSISFVPEYDVEGNFCGVLAIGNDITVAKIATQQLVEMEAQLIQLAENVPDYVIQVDATGHILYVNEHLRLSLENPALRKGNNIFEALSEAKVPSIKSSHDALRQVIKNGKPIEKILFPKPKGVAQIHRVNYVPECDEAGKVRTVLIVGVDITAQKKMEYELRQSVREFRSLADNFPYLIARYDTEFRSTYVNRAYEKLVGIDGCLVINKSIDSVWVLGEDFLIEDFKSHLQRVIATKSAHEFFAKLHGEEGKSNVLEILLVPEFDDNGNVHGILAIGHNTNSYEKSMLELGELNAKLQILSAQRECAREEERKYIAQEIHDELGQLLSVLHLNASSLNYIYGASNPDLNDKTETMMAIANKAIETVRHLIIQLRPAIMALGFVYALECLTKEFSRNSGISHFLDVATGLKVDIDEGRAVILLRIVQEILTNVMRHSRATFVNLNISAAAGYIILTIKDDGIGFNKDAIRRADAFGVIGMQERVLVLGGELEIISEPSRGTVIKVKIPVVSPATIYRRRHDDSNSIS